MGPPGPGSAPAESSRTGPGGAWKPGTQSVTGRPGRTPVKRSPSAVPIRKTQPSGRDHTVPGVEDGDPGFVDAAFFHGLERAAAPVALDHEREDLGRVAADPGQ